MSVIHYSVLFAAILRILVDSVSGRLWLLIHMLSREQEEEQCLGRKLTDARRWLPQPGLRYDRRAMTRPSVAPESVHALAGAAPPFAPRIGLAALVARVLAAATRRLGRGGTALPGLVAETLAPDFVSTVARQLSRGVVLLTGTNGKTTTARMLAAILDRGSTHLIHNAAGSNLSRGLSSSLAQRTSWRGRLRANEATLGLFEMDEAAFVRVAPALRPRLAAFTNLLRDQLDRYGEVDAVAVRWQKALADTTPTPQLILNADDPLVAGLGDAAPGAFYFGVEAPSEDRPTPEHAADIRVCPTCGQSLVYRRRFYAHLGHFRCPNGHRDRPTPAVRAVTVEARGIEGTELELLCLPPVVPEAVTLRFFLPVGGLYNVYNALAATTTALALGVAPTDAREALSSFTPAFGRMEQVVLDGRTIYLSLAKNPTGLNQVVRLLAAEADRTGPLSLLIALNDLDADGRDISWIWDADLEELAQPGRVGTIVASGRRAADLAVRLKYAGIAEASTAGISPHLHQPAVVVEGDLRQALAQAVHRTPAEGTLHVVPTYTALLELRGLLTRQGALRPYWRAA